MWSPLSPESLFSPMSDSDMHSPYTMNAHMEEEVAIAAEKRFREEHGYSALPGEIAAKKQLRKMKAVAQDEGGEERRPPRGGA